MDTVKKCNEEIDLKNPVYLSSDEISGDEENWQLEEVAGGCHEQPPLFFSFTYIFYSHFLFLMMI